MGITTFIKSFFYGKNASEEWNEISLDIDEYCKKVLGEEGYNSGVALTNKIISGGKKKEDAISFLQIELGVLPKRPLYYVTMQFLPRLPSYTRDIVRYEGDYIDFLIRNHILKKGFRGKSFGYLVENIKNLVSSELYENLKVYNRIFYVPAKHDFKVEKRNHRFTCKETVLITLVTIKLADEIKGLSLGYK